MSGKSKIEFARDIESYKQHLCQNVQPSMRPFAEASGLRTVDVDGDEVLDFASQTLNLNLGQCHPRIVKAATEQASTLQYTSSRYLDEPTLRLAKALADVAPDGLNRVNPKVTGGSLANECAIKMARKKHDGNAIATTHGSFFGETCEMMRCSGKYFEKEFLGDGGDFVHFEAPYANGEQPDHADDFRDLLESRPDICGVLLTPIDVNAGVVAFSEEYLNDLRAACDEYDVALIFDEVQTGFGWLGDMFAAEYFDVTPDIMTVAKGLSAGFPLGAVICTTEYDVVTYGEHEFTYGAHPVSSATALETIDIVTDEMFVRDVKEKSAYLDERLARLPKEFSSVADVRVHGLIAGVDIVEGGEPAPQLAEAIFEDCLEGGIMFRLSGDFGGNALVIKPPATVEMDQIDEAMDVLWNVLDSY
jgi:4-aminobutyrate aminotransferase